MKRFLIIIFTIFILFSCGGEDISNGKNNNELLKKNLTPAELFLEQEQNKLTDFPVEKVVTDISKEDTYKEDKHLITKMNVNGQTLAERLGVCRPANSMSFPFVYSAALLNAYMGRLFLHLETDEPLNISNVDEMDCLLPFSPQTKSTFDELYSFSSYFSVANTILPSLLENLSSEGFSPVNQFYYNKDFKIPSANMKKNIHPVLLYGQENGADDFKCWSPKDSDFLRNCKNNNSGDFKFYNLNSNYHFNNFDTNSEQELCRRNEESDNQDSDEISDISVNIDTYEWIDLVYYSMDYKINVELDHSYLQTPCRQNTEAYNNCLNAENKFNLLLTENRTPNSINPNSYNVHFPMKTFKIFQKDSGGNAEILLMLKNLDITVDFNFNDIIQSAEAEQKLLINLKSKLKENISLCQNAYETETQLCSSTISCNAGYNCNHLSPFMDIGYCVASESPLCGSPEKLVDSLYSVYDLTKECFDYFKNTNESDLLNKFELFSNNPENIPSEFKNNSETYQICIYKVWTVYNNSFIGFEKNDIEYYWNAKYNSDSQKKTKSCEKWQRFVKIEDHTEKCLTESDGRECTCIALNENMGETVTQESCAAEGDFYVEGYKNKQCKPVSDNVIFSVTNVAPQLTYNYKFFTYNEDGEITEEKIINMNPAKFSNSLNILKRRYKSSVSNNVLFNSGGGFESFKDLISYNYYKNIRYSFNTGFSTCETDVHCNQLNNNGAQYGCLLIDLKDGNGKRGICSTPLAAISTNIRKYETVDNSTNERIPDAYAYVRAEMDVDDPGYNSMQTEDWSEEQAKIYIDNFNLMKYLIPRIDNGQIFVDVVSTRVEGNGDVSMSDIDIDGLENINLLVMDVDAFGSVIPAIEDALTKSLNQVLYDSKVYSIDTGFSVLKTIHENFAKIRLKSDEYLNKTDVSFGNLDKALDVVQNLENIFKL